DIPFFSAILCLSQNNFQFIIFLCLTYYHWAFIKKNQKEKECWLNTLFKEGKIYRIMTNY
ncbi:hypothetical protein, partial [Heyndrickxia sporothermodurans]